MKTKRRWQLLSLVGLGLGLAGTTGCQTNIAGMTLPSGHYLQHPPQYFAPSPSFPLTRELAAMEAQTSVVGTGPGVAAPVTPLPPPASVAPAPTPAPAAAPLPPPNPGQ